MEKPRPASGNHGVLTAILLAILALIVAVISAAYYMNVWNTKTYSRSYPVYPKVASKQTVVVNQNSNQNSPPSATVELTEPLTGATVTSPFQISGSAPGTWFFEAVFPIVLEDAEGNELARTQAQAVGDWMTTDSVEFTASLEFSGTQDTPAVLVFRPDNPSGLPNTEEFRLPITLSAN